MLCVAVSMGVTAEMLRPFLEGWTMKQIIEAKRLFVVDLKILKNLPTVNGRKVGTPVCTWIAFCVSLPESFSNSW